MLCILGAQKLDDAKILEWLEDDRRLFLIACSTTLDHPRIRTFEAQSLMQKQLASNEIGWGAVMLTLEVHAAAGWEEMRMRILESHQAAHLLLSEVADYGLEAFSNARANWANNGPFHPLAALKGKFAGTPAIVCGAGPSLEAARPYLESSGALLFSAGTALALFSQWRVAPHIACVLDKNTPIERLQNFPDAICCLQSRLNPEAIASWKGSKVLAPESGPLPWESWWLGEQESMEFGWTVGNFATKIAHYLGCNPIIWTGMEFCYRGKVKYADQFEQDEAELVETDNRKGESVWTQRDWLAAARWHAELAARHPETRWISTAEEGLPLGDSVETLSWETVAASIQGEANLQGRLHSVLKNSEHLVMDPGKQKEWKESAERSLKFCNGFDGKPLELEAVYQFYLAPLWNLWRPLFEREAVGQDIECHRLLFFQRLLNQAAFSSFP